MGKKSRRKKDDKSSRQERLQERRERIQEVIVPKDYYSDDGDGCSERPDFFPGDRVLFHDQNLDKDSFLRGTICEEPFAEIRHGKPLLRIKPVEQVDMHTSGYINVYCDKVFPDPFNWILRFKVGDHVLCACKEGWIPATITDYFPYFPEAPTQLNVYRCAPLVDDYPGDISVPSDDEENIMKPYNTFRFGKGDSVVFSTSKALDPFKGYRPLPSTHPAWRLGSVTPIHLAGLKLPHDSVYECSYEDKGKTRKCLIVKDDDEDVAGSSTSPRQRLMDSIDQDCSYEHIDYLVQSEGIDVLSFRDLVLDRAIQNASYNMLLWLQEKASIDLLAYRGPNGHGLMHHIAMSPNADRFLRSAAAAYMEDEISDRIIDLLDKGYGEDKVPLLFEEDPDSDRWWVHELVQLGNARALDIIFSPNHGLAWQMQTRSSLTKLLSGLRLSAAELCKANRLFSVTAIIDEFSLFGFVWDMSSRICLVSYLSTSNDTMLPSQMDLKRFKGESRASIAKRLLRFIDVYCDHPRFDKPLEDIVHDLARNGYVATLRWLGDADPWILKVETACRTTNQNADEFTQPERLEFPLSTQQHVDYEDLSLVCEAACGEHSSQIMHLDRLGALEYLDLLEEYANPPSWRTEETLGTITAYLQKEAERSKDTLSYLASEMLSYKLELLLDHESLASRLEMLDYLVKDCGMLPPSPVDVIRWRKCGVLRWLVYESFVDLNEKVTLLHDEYSKAARKFGFETFPNFRIPRDMTVGTFLCLVAIESDDLQSLEWLIGDGKVVIEDIRVDGWNITHLCAYFGRAEIVLSLESHPSWRQLASAKSSRQLYKACYAVHIAVKRGFIFVADRLLLNGCPQMDSKGRGLDYYGRQAEFEFVLGWVEKKEKPLRLAEDIAELYRLFGLDASLEHMKEHVKSTHCLDYNLWEECGFDGVDEPGPNNESFRDVLKACVSAADSDFMKWLCSYLGPTPDSRPGFDIDHSLVAFWRIDPTQPGQKIDHASLVAFSKSVGDMQLITWLKEPCSRDATCIDPYCLSPCLGWLVTEFEKDPRVFAVAQEDRSRLIRTFTLKKLVDTFERETERLLAVGASTQHVRTSFEYLETSVKALTEDTQTETTSYLGAHTVLLPDCSLNLDCLLLDTRDRKSLGSHPLEKQMYWSTASFFQPRAFFVVLATEGYSELISLCLSRKSNWDRDKELHVARIAGYLGHQEILDLFLQNSASDMSFCSSADERVRSALLGAAEAGIIEDLAWNSPWFPAILSDPILKHAGDWTEMQSMNTNEQRKLLEQSITGTIAYGYIKSGPPDAEKKYLELISLIISSPEGAVTAASFLFIVACILVVFSGSDMAVYSKFFTLLEYLTENHQLAPWRHESALRYVCEVFVDVITYQADTDVVTDDIQRWFLKMIEIGVDIQDMNVGQIYRNSAYLLEIRSILSDVQSTQRRMWSLFDIIKTGAPFETIKEAVENGQLSLKLRDRGGFYLTHLAAIYDRADVLRWLVEEQHMSLDDIDGQGRTVLEVACASKASETTLWIKRRRSRALIASFVSRNRRRVLACRRKRLLLTGIIQLQALFRGSCVRRSHGKALLSRMESSQRFQVTWGRSLRFLDDRASLVAMPSSWASMKHTHHDMLQARELWDDTGNAADSWVDTDKRLEEATAHALEEAKLPPVLPHDELDVALDNPGGLRAVSRGKSPQDSGRSNL